MPDQIGNTQSHSILNSLCKLRSNLLDNIIRRFSNPQTARRNRFILLFVTTFLLTFITLPGHHFTYKEFKPGDIATSDIRAPQDYLIDDHSLTEQRRKEVGNNAPVIYNLNERVPLHLAEKLETALSAINGQKTVQPNTDFDTWRKLLAPLLDTELDNLEIQALLNIKTDRTFLESSAAQLKKLYDRRIVLDGKVFQTDSRRGIEILDNNGRPLDIGSPSDFTEISDARAIVAKWNFPGLANNADASKISSVIARTLLPNLFYNQEASEAHKKAAMEAVRPVLFKVQKGEMIVRTGERITPEQSQKLRTIFLEEKSNHRFITAAGLFSLIMVLFYFPYRFACKNIRKFNPSNRDILVISLLIAVSFLVFKTAMQIGNNIGPVFPNVDANSYFYLFPFAAGAMIVRVLINSEVALVYCAVTATLLGIMFNNNMFVVIYALLGSIIGAHGMRQCSDRSTIYSAGLKVSVVNLALALSFQAFNDSLFTVQTIYVVIFAAVGGVLNSGFVSGFIPVIESLFHYTTDIKLLELANLNSPLLRDLMVRAPGTYHHSVVVG
ncbi:MAG: HD family phosphohydrolase, partial [Geobacteraceae bacterium GWC2_48_7]